MKIEKIRKQCVGLQDIIHAFTQSSFRYEILPTVRRTYVPTVRKYNEIWLSFPCVVTGCLQRINQVNSNNKHTLRSSGLLHLIFWPLGSSVLEKHAASSFRVKMQCCPQSRGWKPARAVTFPLFNTDRGHLVYIRLFNGTDRNLQASPVSYALHSRDYLRRQRLVCHEVTSKTRVVFNKMTCIEGGPLISVLVSQE